MSIRHVIRRSFNAMRLDIHRFDARAHPALMLQRALDHHAIDIVFDIGANVGQFASGLRQNGYRGEIVSFEPLTSAHMELTRAARTDPAWRVHERGAIGDRNGGTQINIAGNSVSSSLLPMLEAHIGAASASRYIGSEPTPLHTLDSVSEGYLSPSSRLLVKIDTQGSEWDVLDGAPITLSRAHGVCCELSLVALYHGQRLWRDVVERLEHQGFTLWSAHPGFSDARDGRTLQLDALFFRMERYTTAPSP